MATIKTRWGGKEICPCPHGKKKFSRQLDEHGHPTGAGKCWSPACGQRFVPATKQYVTQQSDSNTVLPTQLSYVYRTDLGNPHMRITVVRNTDGSKRVYAERWENLTWVKGVIGVDRILYRLPELLERIALDGTVVVCEGERDVDRAHDVGITATCNPFGAGKWLDSMSLVLAGARVVIVPDLDEAGWKHARQVEQSLREAGVEAIGILDLRTLMPELPEKGDLSDYLDRGGDPDRLRQAIEKACVAVGSDADASAVIPLPSVDWDALPNALRDLVRPIDDERQRVALLMAAITVIGSVIPGVTTRYYGQDYGPSLYLFICGPPGSGKGSVTPAARLVDDIEREIREASIETLKAYEIEHAQWRSRKNKSIEPPPEKPVRKALRLSADSTGSVIIRATCNNPTVLVFDTEGDTLSVALRPDTIDASSALRKAWHHERIDQERVTDALHVVADRPNLSMVLTGTPNQILSLVKHVESGLTSRISFIQFPPQKQFRDPFSAGLALVDAEVKTLQRQIRLLWAFVRDHSKHTTFQVVLASDQQERHVRHFRERFEDEIEGADEGATLRAGIVAVRIIIVLTVVRRWFSDGVLEPRMVATDNDFTLGLQLAELLRLGTDAVIHSLSANGKQTPLPPAKRKTQEWYASLPEEPSTQEAVDTARRFGIGRSTVFTLLGQEAYFDKIGHGRYRKRQRSQNRGP